MRGRVWPLTLSNDGSSIRSSATTGTREGGRYIILDVRDLETGKRRRKWHSFRGTKREAQNECARLISEMQGCVYLEPSKATLGQLLEHWLDHTKQHVSPKSHERYSEIVRKNIVPLLGLMPLTKIKPAHISAAYAKALAGGRRNGAGGLSPATVHYMHRLMKQALAQAVRWQLFLRNPAEAVSPPRVERGFMNTYDVAQAAELLDAARGTRLHVPVVLELSAGFVAVRLPPFAGAVSIWRTSSGSCAECRADRYWGPI